MEIRTLRADEIECRVQVLKADKCSLLLYKDARCDMKVLDETFGVMGWEREHTLINGSLFCTISVWDKEKGTWIKKQDVGTESFSDKEKGQASDSFKRAAFNWGIGRELYTAPFIWINLAEGETKKETDPYTKKEKITLKTKFVVSDIGYNDNKEIIKLVVKDTKGNVRYTLGGSTYQAPKAPRAEAPPPQPPPVATTTPPQAAPQQAEPVVGGTQGKKLSKAQVNRLFAIAKGKGYEPLSVTKCVLKAYNINALEELTKMQYDEVVAGYEGLPGKE